MLNQLQRRVLAAGPVFVVGASLLMAGSTLLSGCSDRSESQSGTDATSNGNPAGGTATAPAPVTEEATGTAPMVAQNTARTEATPPRADATTAEPSVGASEEGHQWPDATFSAASPAVNRQGLPQAWQVAPDAELPEDFAPGDVLVDVWASEPGTLTPYVSRDAYATRVHREVLEQLIWTDVETLRHVPGLAKSWEVSEDGLEYTFHLFENACFSDKEPVTSRDVIFTFDLIMNQQIDAPVTRSYVEDFVASWEALDEHTVRFRMKEPYFLALDVVGEQWILPKHIYGDYPPNVYNESIGELCVGSGPYVVERWDRGAQIVLARNENYWGPKPALDKRVLRIMNNALTRWQDFRSEKVDLIGPTPGQWSEYRTSKELAEVGRSIYYYSPLGGYLYVGYNLRLPKFADKRTRQAMTLLIDREEVLDTMMQGIGEVVSGPFYFQGDQYNKDIEPWPHDPEWARELLAEAGWADTDRDGVLDQDLDGDGDRDPFEIVFLIPSGGDFGSQFQRYVESQFAEAGIKVTLDVLDWSVFEQRLTERNFEMVMLAWTGSPESDPYQIWHSSQAENRGSNHVGYRNPRVDELIDSARRELDYDKRMAMWHEVHAILHEDQPYTFLFNRPSMGFINGRFKNVVERPLRLYTSEWYVPAADQMRSSEF